MLTLKKRFTASLFLLSVFFFNTAHAGQFKNVHNIEAHYSVFPSSFLTADVAKIYKLERDKKIAVLNISLLDKTQLGKPAIQGEVTGNIRNIIGQIRTLKFTQLTDGDSVYYVAQFKIDDNEQYIFDIHVDGGSVGKGKFQFKQILYQQ